MITNIDNKHKIAEIWLTRADQQDEALQMSLKDQYAQWKRKGYMVAVYHSGNGDLYQQTCDLLAYNKQRSAEQEVRHQARA